MSTTDVKLQVERCKLTQGRAAKDLYNYETVDCCLIKLFLVLSETKSRPIIFHCMLLKYTHAFIYKANKCVLGSCFTVIFWLQTVLGILHKRAVSSSCSRLTSRYCSTHSSLLASIMSTNRYLRCEPKLRGLMAAVVAVTLTDEG